MYYFLRRP